MIASLTGLSIATVAVAQSALAVVGSDDRRLRRVERDPRIATVDDVELLLRAHAVREEKIWAVLDRVEAADLQPSVVWAWTMQYDGTELAELCASRASHAEVRDHLLDLTVAVDAEVHAAA